MTKTKTEPNLDKETDFPSPPTNTTTNAPTDWRSEMLDQMRMLIKQADPDVAEVVKWRKPSNAMRGVPVWEHDGIICTGETYKQAVKLTFAKGAALPDPAGLFTSSLEGNARRAIDFREGETLDAKRATAFKALIRAAVALNTASRAKASPVRVPKAEPKPKPKASPKKKS